MMMIPQKWERESGGKRIITDYIYMDEAFAELELKIICSTLNF